MAEEKVKKPRFSSLEVEGVKYKTYLTTKYKNREKYRDPEPNKVLAFIPGTVAKMLIAPKKQVKEGEVVMILDAMKMMNKVIAPMDGEVNYFVKENQIISKNQVLFEIL